MYANAQMELRRCELQHTRKIRCVILRRIEYSRIHHLQKFWGTWLDACEDEWGRERNLELRLHCLRKLRAEFAHFVEQAKSYAFSSWVEVTERGRARQRDLNVRLKVLVGRFGHVTQAWGMQNDSTRSKCCLCTKFVFCSTTYLPNCLFTAVFFPWREATRRKMYLFAKTSRFLVRWQNKKLAPLVEMWRDIIRTTRELEDSTASKLLRE